MMNGSTIIRFVETGIPDFASRGIQETLELISSAYNARRTVNGTLRNLARPAFSKYSLSYQCEDHDVIPEGLMRPGTIITVHCLTELSTAGTLPVPASSWTGNVRPMVPGSLREANGLIYYRPIIAAAVTGFQVQRDEWGATVSWTLNLEEV